MIYVTALCCTDVTSAAHARLRTVSTAACRISVHSAYNPHLCMLPCYDYTEGNASSGISLCISGGSGAVKNSSAVRSWDAETKVSMHAVPDGQYHIALFHRKKSFPEKSVSPRNFHRPDGQSDFPHMPDYKENLPPADVPDMPYARGSGGFSRFPAEVLPDCGTSVHFRSAIRSEPGNASPPGLPRLKSTTRRRQRSSCLAIGASMTPETGTTFPSTSARYVR